ncbi:MAG: HlyC/CorC family transporter [Candidatus Izimaplasma sp.]|nr:HlyC/CorC family transporter [Candidatus Izimaplasma bacterium]
MSETVFSSVNVIRLKTFIENSKKGSKKALWITDHFDLTLSTILVGNNLANIALATVSVGVFSKIFVNEPTLINVANTLVMTTLILIFGEIVPKSFGKNNSENVALKISGILYWIIQIGKPFTWIFLKIKQWIVKDAEAKVSVTGDELETIIDTMEEEGSIDEDEAEMLQSVLDLSEKKIYEIMTPRVDMIAIDIEDTIDEIKETFFKHTLSRLPVFEDNRDNVIGILFERDFFTNLIKGEKINVREMMKEPFYVSTAMRVDTLIETLQRENLHLAIVSDEYGGTSGIVTMEDALEELVGEIYDEHDEVEDEFIQPLKENKYGINAEIDLEDLFDDLELGNPPESHYSSLSGWLYDMIEDIPEVDDSYSYVQEIINYNHDEEEPRKILLKFVVKDIKDRRIHYVHLTIEENEKE